MRPRYANDGGFTQVLEENEREAVFFGNVRRSQIKRDALICDVCHRVNYRRGNFLLYC